MHIIDNYGYPNVVLAIVTIGLIIDVIVHLAKQMKSTGEWGIDYSNFATFIIGSMLMMAYITRACWECIKVSMLISIWILLPLYSLLRNLKKINK